MIRVLLVGLGGMGLCHYGEYKKLGNCKLCAVVDAQPEEAAEKLHGDGIKVYSDYKQAIETEKPDIVDICTPSYMHADMSIYALTHGCNVLCEKPMALSYDDCRRVVECAKDTGKLFMTAQVVRFMTPYVYLRNEIENKELGELIHLDVKRCCGNPKNSWNNWFLDNKKSRGALFDLSVHDIDFVQSVLGMPKKINAVYKEKTVASGNDIVLAQLIYDKAAVTLTGAFYNNESNFTFKASYCAIFENGYIEYDGKNITKNGDDVSVDYGRKIEGNSGLNIKDADGYYAEIEYFVKCVEEGRQPEFLMPQSSADSIRIAEKIAESANLGK